jgi:hypothetical protein
MSINEILDAGARLPLPRFSPELIAEIRGSIALWGMVGRYVELRPLHHDSYVGPCPFCAKGEINVTERSRPKVSHYYCLRPGWRCPPPPKDIRDDPELMSWWVSQPRPDDAPPDISCGAQGEIIGFLMRKEQLGYEAAMLRLCDEAEVWP